MNKRIVIKARVGSRASASMHLKQPGDAVLVDRGGLRWLVLSCPCGCGAEVPVNLDRRAGPAWRLYESPKGTSVYPSVWRDTDCKSHFIIWRNIILMLGGGPNGWIEEPEVTEDDLLRRVREVLSADGQSVEEISDQIIGSVPWDVLRCCRKLCRQGIAVEGRGTAEGRFSAALGE
jgi:hypothetical protein